MSKKVIYKVVESHRFSRKRHLVDINAKNNTVKMRIFFSPEKDIRKKKIPFGRLEGKGRFLKLIYKSNDIILLRSNFTFYL